MLGLVKLTLKRENSHGRLKMFGPSWTGAQCLSRKAEVALRIKACAPGRERPHVRTNTHALKGAWQSHAVEKWRRHCPRLQAVTRPLHDIPPRVPIPIPPA